MVVVVIIVALLYYRLNLSLLMAALWMQHLLTFYSLHRMRTKMEYFSKRNEHRRWWKNNDELDYDAKRTNARAQWRWQWRKIIGTIIANKIAKEFIILTCNTQNQNGWDSQQQQAGSAEPLPHRPKHAQHITIFQIIITTEKNISFGSLSLSLVVHPLSWLSVYV